MKRIKKAALLVVGFYLFITTAMFLLQEKLIFLPTKLPVDYSYKFQRPFEEIFLDTQDGARLNALYFKSENNRGLVLYFHGNAGDLTRWGEITAYFQQFDYDVLVMDYRTYGKSTGELSEEALYEDAELFYEKAKSMYAEDQIVVYGRSLGSAFATHVAAVNNPSRLVLESPFYSLEYLAKKRYWLLPVKQLLQYRFPTNEKMKLVKCPVLIIHGTEDAVVPVENGKKLHKTLPEHQSVLVKIPEGSHNDLIEFQEYHKAMESLFE